MNNDSEASDTEICPYCDGGVLEDLDGYDFMKACSNGGACPATFVAVIG